VGTNFLRKKSKQMNDEEQEEIEEIEQEIEGITENEETLIVAAGDGDIKEVKRLIKLGWDVNSVAINGITALSEAILFEHVKIVKLLIEKGAKIRRHLDLQGNWDSINKAITVGNVEIVKLLLESEQTKYTDDKYKYFLGACKRGHKELIRYLIDNTKIRYDLDIGVVMQNDFGVPGYIHTGVQRAIQNKHFEIVELFVKAGIHQGFLNQKTKEGRTYLIQSVIDNEEVLAKLLVEGGADLTITDDLLKCTPLMWSVVGNNIPMTKLLIDAKANVNTARESDGMTALMFSMLPDMTRLLIDSSADAGTKDHLGLTALNYAQRDNNIEIAKLLR
jgi:ankyrin repeat protein